MMKFERFLIALLLLTLTGCTSQTAHSPQMTGDQMELATKHKKLSYTFEDFIASPGYRDSRDYWRGAALERTDPRHSYVEVLLAEQRGRLYINGQIAMDFPLCSGRFGGKETPVGSFRITEKVRDKRSTLYGSFVDAGEKVVKGNVSFRDQAPAGSHFLGASMPYWMRFNGAIGLHVGNVHREGASHGCVRVPEEAARILFQKLAVGSRVIVR